jgi:hypothetical protein
MKSSDQLIFEGDGGYIQVTSLGTAVGITVPNNAKGALINVQGQAVRFRADGTNPTASVGFPLSVGSIMKYTGPLQALRFIEQAAGAVLNIVFIK